MPSISQSASRAILSSLKLQRGDPITASLLNALIDACADQGVPKLGSRGFVDQAGETGSQTRSRKDALAWLPCRHQFVDVDVEPYSILQAYDSFSVPENGVLTLRVTYDVGSSPFWRYAVNEDFGFKNNGYVKLLSPTHPTRVRVSEADGESTGITFGAFLTHSEDSENLGRVKVGGDGLMVALSAADDDGLVWVIAGTEDMSGACSAVYYIAAHGRITGGTWSLQMTLNDVTETLEFDWDVDKTTMQTAMRAHAEVVTPSEIVVTGGQAPVNEFRISLTGSLADASDVFYDPSSLGIEGDPGAQFRVGRFGA